MRNKFWAVFIAVAGVLLAGSINVTAASAVTAPAEDAPARIASCANPPDKPDATAENRDRFVGLWIDRIKNKAWLDDFIAASTIPADVKAEGFHDMPGDVQVWLAACLVDEMLDVADEGADAAKYNKYIAGIGMIVFGKAGLNKMREELNAPETEAAPTQQLNEDLTAQALADMVSEGKTEQHLTSAELPKAQVNAPSTVTSTGTANSTTPSLQQLVNAPAPTVAASEPETLATTQLVPEGLEPHPITQLPLVPTVLAAVDSVLQLIAEIQGVLFTLPVVNILASAFYKICAESATMPLKCSISLPIGVPIPADVTGDNVPDVAGMLGVFSNLKDVGAKFQVQRLAPNAGPLPAHVFAVYDTPFVKKRIEFGFDGRASSLGTTQAVKGTLENAIKAITGDIEVTADVTSKNVGNTAALSFAVKDLVGGSAFVLPSEENPMAGAVQFAPFPTDFSVNAHLIHTSSARSQDIFTVESNTQSKVNAQIDQRTTTTPVKSNRRFLAEIDKLPTKVVVDLVREGEHQSIDYRASSAISSVKASDKTIPDIAEDSYTESVYQVKGVPTEIDVDLIGAQDITYKANAKIPEVSFATETVKEGVLKQRITAAAHQIPKNVHVLNKTDAAEQRITYTADDKIGDIVLGMYDKDENGVETNLAAKATGIPKQMEFVSTKATGAYDLTSDTGIDLIEATLTRNNGQLLPMPGTDHATVYKRGEQLGLDFRLTGFKSAHFQGNEQTEVSLGLNPGGQTFDAVADIDDPDGGPNVYATAHVGALPANMALTFDPDNGEATYAASSIIPLLTASFTDRDTEMFGNATLTDLPKNIGVTFNTTGATPEVTYDADSRLGSIELNYSEKPGGLGIHGLISDLPQYMRITGLDPIVFDARTGPAAASGSSDIGQILFQFATDGVFQSPSTTDDHAYLSTDTHDQTHAELQYSGLRYLSVDTSDQELHATVKNTAARLFRAYVYTPTVSLEGFIDKVPAEITISQVGNLITYDASSTIDEISTDLVRDNGDTLAVQIQDIPSHVEVLFDGAGAKLVWNSSSATGLISALAHLTPETLGTDRAFDAGLTITDIPVHWDATWANGDVAFNTSPGGIGSIAAKVTNHGSYHQLVGDHLSAYYDQPSGDLDASLKISNLQKIEFAKLAGNPGGFDAKLNMGDHGSLAFAADVNLGTTVLKASGAFDHLPSQIHLRSEGGRITYDGDDNPDLTVSVEAGHPAAIAATPAAPFVHGVSVRDGASGANKAVKAKLYLTGLPDHLDLNSPAGTYHVNGYNPTNGTLVVDVKLVTLAPQALSLYLTQGVPTASPVNFTFGPFLTSTAGDGTHNVSLNYTANQTLGALDATAQYGNTDEAGLYISAIPSSISVNAALGADTKTVGVNMAHGISKIVASYKKVGDIDLAARVELRDVPSSVNINIGKESDSGNGTDVDAPVFTMTTSAPGMDIDAFATAAIATPVNANAAVTLAVVDLGQTVTADLIGNRLNVTSSPATGSFAINAAGRVQKDVSLFWDGGIFQNRGKLDIDLKIGKVTLGLTDFSNVNFRLGFTTGVDGSFSSFTFGQESNLTVDLEEHFYVHIDWPDPFGSDDIDLISPIDVTIPLGNVVPRWRVNKNVYGTIFEIPFFHFLIGDCHVSFDARPAPGTTTATPIFTLGPPQGAPGETPAWLLTPDITLLGVSLPNFALDIIAFFASPYGNDIDAYPECEVF